MDDRIGRSRLDELGPQSQGPATPGCFDRPYTATRQRRMLGPKDETLHRLVEAGIASGRDVGFRGLTREYRLLRFPHSLENRRISVVITVDTHAKIDLMGVGVRTKRGHE